MTDNSNTVPRTPLARRPRTHVRALDIDTDRNVMAVLDHLFDTVHPPGGPMLTSFNATLGPPRTNPAPTELTTYWIEILNLLLQASTVVRDNNLTSIANYESTSYIDLGPIDNQKRFYTFNAFPTLKKATLNRRGQVIVPSLHSSINSENLHLLARKLSSYDTNRDHNYAYYMNWLKREIQQRINQIQVIKNTLDGVDATPSRTIVHNVPGAPGGADPDPRITVVRNITPYRPPAMGTNTALNYKIKIITSMLKYPENSNLENYLLLDDFLSDADVDLIWTTLRTTINDNTFFDNITNKVDIEELYTKQGAFRSKFSKSELETTLTLYQKTAEQRTKTIEKRNKAQELLNASEARGFGGSTDATTQRNTIAAENANITIDDDELRRIDTQINTLNTIFYSRIIKRRFLSLMILISRNTAPGFLSTLNADITRYFFTSGITSPPTLPIPPLVSQTIATIFNRFINTKQMGKNMLTSTFIKSVVNGSYMKKIYSNEIWIHGKMVESIVDGLGINDVQKEQIRKESSQREKEHVIRSKQLKKEQKENLPLSNDVLEMRTVLWLSDQQIIELPLNYIFDQYTEDEKIAIAKEKQMCNEIANLIEEVGSLPLPNLQLPKSLFDQDSNANNGQDSTAFLELSGPNVLKEIQQERKRRTYRSRSAPRIGGAKKTRRL